MIEICKRCPEFNIEYEISRQRMYGGFKIIRSLVYENYYSKLYLNGRTTLRINMKKTLPGEITEN